MKFAGGQVFDDSGKIVSPNITPDATGIGNYTEEIFVKGDENRLPGQAAAEHGHALAVLWRTN
jgi:hypothetical protein